MASLHLFLGEDEVTYEYDSKKTAAQVGEILEEKYELFSTFFEVCEDEISEDLANFMADRLEKLIEGKPVPKDPFQGIGTKIEARFRKFIYSYEAEQYVKDTPTAAAKKGIRHVGKSKVKGRRRPSFRDTSTLMNAFRVWVESK